MNGWAKKTTDELFDEFWQKYPKKLAKKTAAQAFRRALRKTTFENVMHGLDGYMAELRRKRTEREFILHASTWLNGERWNDQYDRPTGKYRNVGESCGPEDQ